MSQPGIPSPLLPSLPSPPPSLARSPRVKQPELTAYAQVSTLDRSSPAGSSTSSRAWASLTSSASLTRAKRASAPVSRSTAMHGSVLTLPGSADSHLFKPRFPEHFVYLIQDIRDADDQNLIRIFPQCVPSFSSSSRPTLTSTSSIAEPRPLSTRRCRPAGASMSTAATASAAHPPSCASPPPLVPSRAGTSSLTRGRSTSQHRLRHDQDGPDARRRVRVRPVAAVLRRAAHRVCAPARGALLLPLHEQTND